jgi:fumarate hydratase class II
MGEMSLPPNAYWGPQTERARLNFPRTSFSLPIAFIHTLCQIKKAAAQSNCDLKLLSQPHCDAIVQACEEAIDGRWDNQFVVDLFQTGSATSTHMNVNEVIANRACEILGTDFRQKPGPIHPNDHVNMGQSSNDVVPTAMHICILQTCETDLIPELVNLSRTLHIHAGNWDLLVKPGRTHLQDATPIRIGQVFSGYAHLVDQAVRRLTAAMDDLHQVALGGTAVGTGINTHPHFAKKALLYLSRQLQHRYFETPSHFSAQSTLDCIHQFTSTLHSATTSLMKIANDIRWLSSGPRTGLGEFSLPALQPGSSIMPGKVNPVILESFLQIACQVLGNCHTVTLAAQRSEFELNVFMPLAIYNALTAISLLSKGVHHLNHSCLSDLKPNIEHCQRQAQKSPAIATPLARKFGYQKVAQWVKMALDEDTTITAIVERETDLTPEEKAAFLDLIAMTQAR